MKKIIAILAAAVLIVAVAGCVNKAPQQEQTTGQTTAENDGGKDTAGENNGYQNKITQYTTRKPSPSRLTSRPTTERTTPAPIRPTTARSTTTKAAATKPVTTAPSYTEPTVEYGGTLGTQADSVRIKSHDIMLSQNNTFIINLKLDIVACSGTTEYIYIGFDCFDATGKKINSKPVETVVSVRPGEAQTIAITTAPINTAKIVFKNV